MTLLTVSDVAAALRVSQWTVREYLRIGKLRGQRLGGNGPWRVRSADLEAFLEAPAAPSTPRPRPVTGRIMRQVRGLG
jgi:excisionase family DNA binding protein